MSQKYLLGIDAGNTKTSIAVATLEGKVIKTVQGPAGGISSADITEPLKNMYSTIKKTGLKKNQIQAFHIGAAGIDSEKTLDAVYKEVKKQYPKTNFSVCNDVLVALRSGTDYLPAIALIAGTGTNCYGITADAKIAQTTGVNYILGDEGGGYWIGAHLLRYATRIADGRYPDSKIKNIIFKHFKVKDIKDLPEKIFKLQHHKKDIAALATYLTDDLVKKDKLAKKLADHAADQLALQVTTVAKRLKLTKKEFDAVLVGSIITKHQAIQRRVKKIIKKECPHVTFIVPDCPPEVGALKFAFDLIEEK